MPPTRRRLFVAVVVWATLPLAGCVEADVQSYARYQPDDDSFRCLQVYSNLYATQARDLDHLVSLWERRAHVIINPADPAIFGVTAFERKGRSRFAAVSLGQPKPTPDQVLTTRADLDTIRVRSGRFFLNEHRNLCYYQECVVPGKTLDAVLEDLRPEVADLLTRYAEDQSKDADNVTVRWLTWDEVRQQLRDQAAGRPAPRPAPNEPARRSELRLDADSLRLLKKAGADRSVKLTRVRDVFSVVVPLSKRDAEEALATANVLREALTAEVGKHKGSPEERKHLLDALDGVTVRHVQGAGVEVSVNAVRAITAVRLLGGERSPVEPKRAGYQATVASVQGRGVAIDKTFTVDPLIAEYLRK
ncbi:MAG: hypothetical protein U0804_06645 [Gemmataceae bacterium]